MSPDRIAETGEISYLNLALRESSKYPKKSTACQKRCFSHVQGSTAPPIEVWIKPFQRFAGSQGSALSRIPQDAESPFETRGSARVSTNSRSKRRPQAANLPFSVHGLAEQVGHSLTGKYPTGVFSKSARLMKNA